MQQVKTERELKSQAYLETKKQDANEQLPYDWNELEDIVTGKFGYLSKADAYIKFFTENPSRDDLGDLTINPERASGNYIRITGNDVTFYLNEYKTKSQYGQIKNKLSRGLSAQIMKLFAPQPHPDLIQLFPKTPSCALSALITFQTVWNSTADIQSFYHRDSVL